MVKQSLESRVIEFLYAIDDWSQVVMSPAIFSDDGERHDCDNCPAGEINQGDTFDQGVCMDCWERAIHEAFADGDE